MTAAKANYLINITQYSREKIFACKSTESKLPGLQFNMSSVNRYVKMFKQNVKKVESFFSC